MGRLLKGDVKGGVEGGQGRVNLKAPTWEECCEWVMMIKEEARGQQ